MNESPKKIDLQSLFLGVAAILAACSIGYFALSNQQPAEAAPRKELTLKTIPFDGQTAYQMLKQICAIGPRISNTSGMKQQQDLLLKHFKSIGADEVRLQAFQATDPRDRSTVPMANLIASWHLDRKERIVLCAHYDTRPFPDRDPIPSNRKLPFIGANDGASGVALLAELGKHLEAIEGPFGFDIVLFDGEEFVFGDKDPYFLGSTFFAEDYVRSKPDFKYRWGILLDMVGDANLQIRQELHSRRWARPLVDSIWRTARKLGVREFIARPGHEIQDDHLPLNNIAGIPCIDIIDFDYPRPGKVSYWHTIADTPDKCSALSLAKVGYVVHEWLKQVSATATKKQQSASKKDG